MLKKPKILFIGPYPPPYSGPEMGMKLFLESSLKDEFQIFFLKTNVHKSNAQKGKFDFIEPYNLDAAKVIKPGIGDLPLILVGGIRKMDQMEDILNNNYADLISMSRPFIREPYFIRSLKEGKKTSSDCQSCNRCIAAIFNDIPVGCYAQGLPKKK